MLVNVTSYTGTLFTVLIFENFQGNATYLGFFQSIAAIGSIVSGLMKTLSISLIPFSTLLAGYLGNVTSVQTMFFFRGVYLTVCGILVIFMINLNSKSKSS